MKINFNIIVPRVGTQLAYNATPYFGSDKVFGVGMFFDSGSVHPYASFWMDVIDKVIKAAAVLIAGLWAYFNSVRSRTFKRKLEATIQAEMFEKNGSYFALASFRLKNIGQSQCTIARDGTAVVVTTLSAARREELSASDVFERHEWIEPGEQIDDSMVLPVPDPATFIALKLDLVVESEEDFWYWTRIVKDCGLPPSSFALAERSFTQ